MGLNFSCDGSHYLPWDDFLHNSLEFWLGSGEPCTLTSEADPVSCAAS